ncbi:MAG TPA: CpaD family pilus assembly lipoprotein [Sphingomicrobium sp.]|nr:CpaD family pilus assembly lipoprotein [Sphingomicrobium sp.]
MRSKLLIIGLAAGVAACNTTDKPRQGMSAVHVPVVSRTDFVFDAATPNGSLAPGEAVRLDAWFRTLAVRYGDTVSVDGFDSGAARSEVAGLAGNYGLLVSPGAPVTAGEVQPGTIRVIVSRNAASVPGCPDWHSLASPNFNNENMSNYGCAVNSALAAQIANPEDLVHGQSTLGVADARTATKPVNVYRTAPPTGTKGLPVINTKGGN